MSAGSELTFIGRQYDLNPRDISDLNAAELHRGADFQTVNGAGKKAYESDRLLKHLARADHHDRRDQQNEATDDEHTYSGRTKSFRHDFELVLPPWRESETCEFSDRWNAQASLSDHR